jgi:nitrate reductase delta subunit
MSATSHASGRRTLQVVSLCLGYPDESLLATLPMLRQAGGLECFLDHVEQTPLAQLQAEYVETLDLRRRCCLYLTYYTFGDTRDRGVALLEFVAAYRAAGFEVASEELPDHLAVVCEFAARCPDQGVELLQRNRAGVELLALALHESGSAYAEVVDALRAVLPAASQRDVERAMDLARSGPPAEQVGLR